MLQESERSLLPVGLRTRVKLLAFGLALATAVSASSLTAARAHHRSARSRRHTAHRGITRTALKHQSHVLHSALYQKEARIRASRTKIQVLANRSMALSEQIHQDELAEEDAAARLSAGQARLDEINVKLAETLAQLAEARRRLVNDRRTLKLRLREVYEGGSVGLLQVLLDSHNVPDFMNRREYASRVVHRDLTTVRSVHLDEREIDAESRFLSQMRTQKVLEVSQMQVQTNRLSAALADRAAVLQATEQQMAAAQESMAEMEAQSADIEAMLHRLQSMPILTIPGPHGRQLRYRLHWTGHFIIPVSGPITSPFGYRYHPILHVYKLHTGIDIGAPWGSPVHAAASGVVVHASWLGAYGNGIIIDHGNGLATLYGHLSRLDVVVGQAVGQGEVIGAVGSTGLSTGPHLHFEARKYGTPIPPF